VSQQRQRPRVPESRPGLTTAAAASSVVGVSSTLIYSIERGQCSLAGRRFALRIQRSARLPVSGHVQEDTDRVYRQHLSQPGGRVPSASAHRARTGKRVEARSAGIGALVNHPAEEAICAMMNARGVDLSTHRASQLTPARLRWAELVLVMEKHHRDAVLAMDPTARGKTFLLGHWTNHGDSGPLPARRCRPCRGDPVDRGGARSLDQQALLTRTPWSYA
jgi:protein-tyrosine-phosphatase